MNYKIISKFIKDISFEIPNAKTFVMLEKEISKYSLNFDIKSNAFKDNIIDTLEIAQSKYPGSQNSLDALCKRFNIDNSRRKKHNALLDCQLLKEIYVNLIDQKEPKLNLKNSEIVDLEFKDNFVKKPNGPRKIIKPSSNELKLHRSYLKSQLQKNFYN